MHPAIVFLLGLGVGSLIAALAARVLVRRLFAKTRAAERRARAAERLAEIGGMTGGLAHEIKNPLSTIGLNAQLLGEAIEELPQDRAVDAETRHRLTRRLESLRREAERLRGILADFLAYAGEMRLDMAPADVNAAIEELADFIAPQADRLGVRLRTETAAGARASVDVPLLKQALLNLLLNALQAFPAAALGGPRELIVRTTLGIDPDKKPIVRVHVIDTGPGIAPEIVERIFTPYFTTKSGGSGLGLATTRRIIEAHAGRVEVHTQMGKGTEFVVTLPACD
ncbi:MAG: HAMP domain-containing histidine kinase [Phycisphaerales bacterium]|nr:HAMP domain-containing histidine kinase [Phycisphaerales bacterium]